MFGRDPIYTIYTWYTMEFIDQYIIYHHSSSSEPHLFTWSGVLHTPGAWTPPWYIMIMEGKEVERSSNGLSLLKTTPWSFPNPLIYGIKSLIDLEFFFISRPIAVHASARLVGPTFIHANYEERGIEKSVNKRVVLLKRGIIWSLKDDFEGLH